ncbi:ABC transporter substrate-binding protein [Nonomuraea insulae]|uniref:ABC transporter substrate-binding protein n=1 Tax=Nonomuraea insulae TaxID=1616787 RepID=A0ABW1CV80_9ACTN
MATSPSKRLLALLVGVVAIVVLIVAWRVVSDRRQTWSSGDPHNELLGVTDGGVLFNDPAGAPGAKRAVMERINRIHGKIQQENQRVARQGAYVKAVLLMPLTVSNAENTLSAITLEQIEHALQGTYTALVRANTTTVFGDYRQVGLQLLLANQGSRQDAGDRLLGKVLEVSEEEHPLVGVLGLGSSVPSTESAVRWLGARRIPMVSAITSADSLTGLPMFWSVSPSNIQYVKALRHYLDTRKTLKSAIVVYDRNRDPYTNSLFTAFRNELSGYVKFPDLSYVGATIDQSGTPNLFAAVVTNLCTAVNSRQNPLDTVLYAGRGADFAYFAQALKTRSCVGTPLTVLAAATGFASTDPYTKDLEEGNVSVIYATSGDGEDWPKERSDPPDGFGFFQTAYRGHGFPSDDLKDGMAMAHHDALAVLAVAARLGPPVPKPADVAAQFGNLVLAYAARGASGDLSFPTMALGRAVGRVIPIKQIARDVPQGLPANFEPYRTT